MWIKMDGAGGYRPLDKFVQLLVVQPVSGLWRVAGRVTDGGTTLEFAGDYGSQADAEAALALLMQQVGVYDAN
jgi:hypothetical protein